jgi:hypothetical protein
MITDCYFYSLENRLIDMTGFNSVTITANTYPIETLIRAASNLVGHRSCWAPRLVNIYDSCVIRTYPCPRPINYYILLN